MVTLSSATAISSSSTIASEHFGLNYLVHTDAGTEVTGVFADIVSDLNGSSAVRFPGGTVVEVGTSTEPALDVSLTNGALAATTLDFLDSAQANGWSVTFVLPMWRFLNTSTQAVDTVTAVSELSAYTAAVIAAADARGVTIDGFELGNEWDVLAGETGGGSLNRAETDAFFTAYANLAADLAVAVQDEIDTAGLYTSTNEPFIAIQALRAWANNTWWKALDYQSALEDAFTDGAGNTNAAGDAVDAIIAHFYLSQPGSGGEVADPETSYTFRNMDDVNAIFGGNLEYLISEWNLADSVPGTNEAWKPENNSADGIQQLEPIIGIFHTMVSEGVDYANFWAVRGTTWNSLYNLDIENGMPASERPVRYIFDLLSDQLIGADAIDLNGSADGSMATIGSDIHVYGFQSSDSTILYFGSRSDTAQSINLDLGNYGTSSGNPLVQVTHISVDDPDLAVYLQETTVVAEQYTFNQFQALSGNFLTFSPYEVISIEIIYNVGLGETEYGTDIQDLMFGTAADDVFIGSAAADQIFGYFGSDTVDYSASTSGVSVFFNAYYGVTSGGHAEGDVLTSIENVVGSAHSDIIIGATEDNVLSGLGGNDQLDGKWGNDTLLGGSGDDTLIGSAGNDTLTGGSGADVFIFSNGHGTDMITDFDVSEDILKLNGVVVDPNGVPSGAVITQNGNDVEISYTGGLTILQDVDLATWQAPTSNGIVDGTSGNDVMDINYVDADGDGVTNDSAIDEVFHGYDGDDTIRLYRGHDIAYGGDGDDTIIANNSYSQMFGEAGNDKLSSGNRSSFLSGGTGDDHLIARLNKGGDHVLNGGTGADRFDLRSAVSNKQSTTVIQDFEIGVDDLRVLGVTVDLENSSALPSDMSWSEVNGTLNLNFWDDEVIVFTGLDLMDLV